MNELSKEELELLPLKLITYKELYEIDPNQAIINFINEINMERTKAVSNEKGINYDSKQCSIEKLIEECSQKRVEITKEYRD